MNIYDRKNAFSLLQKETVLVAFRISRLRKLKIEIRTLETDDSTIGMHLACHQNHVITHVYEALG